MTERKIFNYEIGGKKYTQQAIVWAQIKQLKNLIQLTEFNADLNVMGLIDVLGDKLPKAIAIVLREDGKKLKEKDIDKLAEAFDEELSAEMIVEIVEHFFLSSQIFSLFQKIKKMFGSLSSTQDSTTLIDPLQPSQEETLQSKTKSSGDTVRKNAAPV